MDPPQPWTSPHPSHRGPPAAATPSPPRGTVPRCAAPTTATTTTAETITQRQQRMDDLSRVAQVQREAPIPCLQAMADGVASCPPPPVVRHHRVEETHHHEHHRLLHHHPQQRGESDGAKQESPAAAGDAAAMAVAPAADPDPGAAVARREPVGAEPESSPWDAKMHQLADHAERLGGELQRHIYSFATSRVDTLEDEQFAWTELRANAERVFAALQPLPEFLGFVQGVVLWESPVKSAFFMALYFSLVLGEHATSLLASAFVLTLAYYGLSQERALAAMGLRCLYLDAQRQPAFADASRAKHVEDRKNPATAAAVGGPGAALLAQLADPNASPLYGSNLASTVRSAVHGAAAAGGASAGTGKRPDLGIKDTVLAAVQLQVHDLADILEKLHNMVTWKRPHATLFMLVQLAGMATLVHVLSYNVLAKVLGVYVGVILFVLLPLQVKFPRYRRMFSLTQIVLWPFPTHAEWAIEELAAATRPVPVACAPVGPIAADSATPAAAARAAETTAAQRIRVDVFPCSWNGRSAVLRIRAGATHAEVVAAAGSGSAQNDVYLRVALSDLVRIKKATPRSLWVFKNPQLVLHLRSGNAVVVLDHVRNRDTAFGLLAAASSDPGRRWRASGT
ncbi:hypothetical protein H9P43_004526 [Blastocladiella emersonii ATCC 22665]|nr:hypothetical protein H9P43_004526 [Blastocladiella emersonii ATCC 22665]